MLPSSLAYQVLGIKAYFYSSLNQTHCLSSWAAGDQGEIGLCLTHPQYSGCLLTAMRHVSLKTGLQI